MTRAMRFSWWRRAPLSLFLAVVLENTHALGYGGPMVHDDDIQALREGIAQLGARVDHVSRRVTQCTRLLEGYAADIAELRKHGLRGAELSRKDSELLHRRLDIADRETAHAFERLAQLELASFPHLARDLDQLHAILGDGDHKADQPFDRRERH